MSDPIKDFYSGQTGDGFPVYVGARRQVGGGFLSGLARMVVPIIKYLAPKAFNFARNTLSDVVMDGKSIKEAALTQGANEIKNVLQPATRKRG